MNHHSKNYELVFDNGGCATLQKHDGSIAINYNDMEQLAKDVHELIYNNSDPSEWDGNDPTCYISDEEYYKHARNGGLYAIQLDIDYYLDDWPDLKSNNGWGNVIEFLKEFTYIKK